MSRIAYSAAAGGGADIKHQRVSTGSIAGGAAATVTVTWNTAFDDAEYTVAASVLQAENDNSTLRVHHIVSQTANAVTVRVINDSSLSARTGTVHAIAMRG